MARRTLETAGNSRFANAIAQADAWFLAAKPVATIEVGAATLALADRLSRQAGPGSRADGETGSPAPLEPDSPAQAKHRDLAGRIAGTQNSDGGWGPYPKSPSEPFDTAVALLALQASASLNPANRKALEEAIQTGREHLIGKQLPAGGWPETTRPSGFQSYAQHISTSGWATLALLKTSNLKN
jgi:hypothetical protein